MITKLISFQLDLDAEHVDFVQRLSEHCSELRPIARILPIIDGRATLSSSDAELLRRACQNPAGCDASSEPARDAEIRQYLWEGLQ